MLDSIRRLVSPELTVVITHPPGLGMKASRLALLPARDPGEEELTASCLAGVWAAGGIDVVEPPEVAAALARPSVARAPRFSPGWTRDLGEALGGPLVVGLELLALDAFQTPVQKRFTWKDAQGATQTRTAYSSRTQVRITASFQAADARSGQVFAPHRLGASPSMENHSTAGEPFFPAVADVREWAMTQVQRQFLRMVLPWSETRDVVFFDDASYGLCEARRMLEARDRAGALAASRAALARALADPAAPARQVGRAQYNAGLCSFILGDPDTALPHYRAARDLDPASTIFQDALAECRRVLQLRREAPGS